MPDATTKMCKDGKQPMCGPPPNGTDFTTPPLSKYVVSMDFVFKSVPATTDLSSFASGVARAVQDLAASKFPGAKVEAGTAAFEVMGRRSLRQAAGRSVVVPVKVTFQNADGSALDMAKVDATGDVVTGSESLVVAGRTYEYVVMNERFEATDTNGQPVELSQPEPPITIPGGPDKPSGDDKCSASNEELMARCSRVMNVTAPPDNPCLALPQNNAETTLMALLDTSCSQAMENWRTACGASADLTTNGRVVGLLTQLTEINALGIASRDDLKSFSKSSVVIEVAIALTSFKSPGPNIWDGPSVHAHLKDELELPQPYNLVVLEASQPDASLYFAFDGQDMQELATAVAIYTSLRQASAGGASASARARRCARPTTSANSEREPTGE